MSDSPAAILYDENGNPVSVVLDDGVYKLDVLAGQGTKAADPADAWPTVLYTSRGRPVETDLFNELAVNQKKTLLDVSHTYRIDPNVWGTDTSSGGTVTHDGNQAAAVTAVTGASGSRARLRSHTHFHYEPGKTFLLRQGIVHSDAGQSNQVRRWGILEDSDGLFWALNGTTPQVVRRSSASGSVVETTVDQSSWNIDPLDGTGPSGKTLDITTGHLYEIRFSWYGILGAEYYVDEDLVHRSEFAGVLTEAFLGNPQLPVQYEVQNTGSSSAGSITSLGSSFSSLGGEALREYSFAARTGLITGVGTTEEPLLAIRLKSNFFSKPNRSIVLPSIVTGLTDGARASSRVIYDPTVSGGSWTSVHAQSAVEFNSNISSFSGGQHIATLEMADTQAADTRDISDLFNLRDRSLRNLAFGAGSAILLITGQNNRAGSTDMQISLSWKEIQ